MPTDEQPATHFYGYYISFDATGVGPVDHVLKAVADAGRGSHHTEDWKELGLEEEVQRAAERAAEEFRSRDAEVQALRDALTEVTNELEAEVNHRYGFDPATGEVKGLARRYEVDISVVRMARAVLAGEEATGG